MRVILDTNILLTGVISPRAAPARLLEAWIERRFTLISHELQLAEIREVSRRPKIRAWVRPAEIGRLVNQITALAEMPHSLPAVERSRDPRDDFLLALSDEGAADWLVTGDKNDLLALERHGPTHIVTASRFVAALNISGL